MNLNDMETYRGEEHSTSGDYVTRTEMHQVVQSIVQHYEQRI